MSEWETFCDISYYHLWRVRRKDERGFNDGYHLQNGEEAKALVELLNVLRRERDEAREEINNIRKTLSESGEAIGNGVHNYSIIEMIQNLIKSKSYFIRKSYAEFFKPTLDEEGAK
jgi:hypothetical protein